MYWVVRTAVRRELELWEKGHPRIGWRVRWADPRIPRRARRRPPAGCASHSAL